MLPDMYVLSLVVFVVRRTNYKQLGRCAADDVEALVVVFLLVASTRIEWILEVKGNMHVVRGL